MQRLCIGVSLLALTIGSAGAADLAVKAPTPPAYVAPAFSWTGFYLGAHAGYGWGTGRGTVLGFDIGSAAINGGFGGGQIGYNWQTGGFVLGIEADISGGDIGREDDFLLLGGVGTIRSRIDVFGTVRGRIGVAWDRLLLYATGGFAWARDKIDFTFAGVRISDDQTHAGWTIGAGLEYAFAPNWSAKLEYLYADFERRNYFASLIAGGIDLDARVHTVKFGINYHFGGPAAVVAAY
ncbi:MAG: porin family protein [Variibacter sp.]|nr:porin family protein [Variibacter sp.]